MIKIYILLNNNVPFYIGKTKNSLVKRNGQHMYKYGNSTKIELLDNIHDENWKFWESYYIDLFKSWGFKLLNQNEGGGGPSHHTIETRLKISNRKNKKTTSIFQYSKDGQFINKFNSVKDALSSIGRKGSFIASLTRKNLKTSFGYIWRYAKNDNRDLTISNHKHCIPIFQYDLDMNFIQEWSSATEASNKLNLNLQGINNCCKNKTNTSGNYIWKYKIKIIK